MLVNCRPRPARATAVGHRRRQQPRRHRERTAHRPPQPPPPRPTPPRPHQRTRRAARRRRVGINIHRQAVNAARTDSARPANRRSHPRTVAAGRPTSTATRRAPHPGSLRRQTRTDHLDDIGPARTTRSPATAPGCAPQPVHTARRGRSRTGPIDTTQPPRPREAPTSQNTANRTGKQPTRPQTPSTRTASVSTVSTSCLRAAHGPPGRLRQEKDREGRCLQQRPHGDDAHQERNPHQTALQTPSRSMTDKNKPVVTFGDG